MSAPNDHQTKPARHRTTPADGEETKARLVAVARQLFADRGHAGVAMEEVCSQAEVTRGALYHHFPGKDGLFLAVCEQVAADVTAQVAAEVQGMSDAWSRLSTGCGALLEASTFADVRQILLTDAPSVLGWSRFRELDGRHGLGLLKAGIRAAIYEGFIEPGPVDSMAYLLVSALNEAALLVGRSEDPIRTMRDSMLTINRLLIGISGSQMFRERIEGPPEL
jgi:AcrR family transcriptional regulator